MASSNTSGISSVALSATSVPAGTTAQGTVTLTAAAPTGGMNVSLASSNSAVVTVPATVAIAAGATSATFNATAAGTGTATITASMNGGSKQSPTLTVTSAVTLASITLTASSIVGGNPIGGTATLTAAAPAGGATVTLTSADPVTVPANVVVAAGALSANFSVATRVVSATSGATITGTYAGASQSATLSVTAPTTATANFGVRGPSESETCEMGSDTQLNCTFDGTTSTAPATITEYDWTFGVPGSHIFSATTGGPILNGALVDCSIMPAPPFPAGSNLWFMMTVTLKIHDSAGNVSPVMSDAGIRLLPGHTCGF